MVEGTSIGFGGGEVLAVSESLAEVTRQMAHGLAHRTFLQYETSDGSVFVVNPMQVKVLQPVSASSDKEKA